MTRARGWIGAWAAALALAAGPGRAAAPGFGVRVRKALLGTLERWTPDAPLAEVAP